MICILLKKEEQLTYGGMKELLLACCIVKIKSFPVITILRDVGGQRNSNIDEGGSSGGYPLLALRA